MSDDPARVSFPFNRVGPGIMTADEQWSIHVSRTLNFLGKNQDMVKCRVKLYREIQRYINIMEGQDHLKSIIAGSKAEGLTSYHESDSDIINVFPDVICADNIRPFIYNRNTTVFQADRHNSHAGYTKLKLVNFCGHLLRCFIRDSLVQDASGDKYLSSEDFVSELLFWICEYDIYDMNYQERSGPSIPSSDPEGYVRADNVYAFRCVCPALLQNFFKRPRPYNRPSRNVLHDISTMDAHAVAVGYKGSKTSHLEWRICFTKAEIHLVQSFNDTETKLYILLKMISKLLKLLSKDITSYVMKNIVLWLVELYPVDFFIEELLTYQLIQALRFLKKCVEANFLPSYMIPDRNLLSDRLSPAQRLGLTTFLSTLIQEEGYLLLRCEKLREGLMILYREPDMAEEFQMRRDMAEKLWLMEFILRSKKRTTTELSHEDVQRLMTTDGMYHKMNISLIRIVFPEMISLALQGRSVDALGHLCAKRLRQML